MSGSFLVKTNKAFYNKKSVRILSAAILVLIAAFSFWFLDKRSEDKAKNLVTSEGFDEKIPGWWLADYFGSSVCNEKRCEPNTDPDNDKLTNAQEYYFHSNPLVADTNKNGFDDGEDVARGVDPSREGDVAFEEVVTDESILGETLVYNQDIKEIINELTDPNRIELPKINEAEINVIEDNSQEAIAKYLTESDKVFLEYFGEDGSSYIEQALISNNQTLIEDIKLKFAQALIDFKNLEVPSNALQLHKYGIAYLQLLPLVVDVPPAYVLEDQYSTEGNAWYDQSTALFSLYQKIELESISLENKYK